MDFGRINEKHYIMLVVGLVALYMLMKCDRDQESFDVVPTFPHIPPKHWKPRRRTHWSPWWYYENEYHPAVPMVSHYDSSSYRLPVSSKYLVMPQDMPQDIPQDMPSMEQTTPVVEEVSDIDPEVEAAPEAIMVPEGLSGQKMIVMRRFNFRRMVAAVLLASIFYYFYNNQLNN